MSFWDAHSHFTSAFDAVLKPDLWSRGVNQKSSLQNICDSWEKAQNLIVGQGKHMKQQSSVMDKPLLVRLMSSCAWLLVRTLPSLRPREHRAGLSVL